MGSWKLVNCPCAVFLVFLFSSLSLPPSAGLVAFASLLLLSLVLVQHLCETPFTHSRSFISITKAKRLSVLARLIFARSDINQRLSSLY